MNNFNNKTFNGVAFAKYVENVPNVKKNELVKSAVLKPNAEIKKVFSSQGSSGYALVPMYGKIEGDALNYDGKTDIISNTTKTFERGVVVIGRANAWVEDDFAEDLTSGASFMSNVASQIKEYFEEVDQNSLLAILKGVFSMKGSENEKFVKNHTLSIDDKSINLDATTVNIAIQNACGDNKKKFAVVIMHSFVASNLENLNLLNYLKYTDKDGIQRDLGLATLNGKTVLIDDSMPTEKDANGETIYTTYILGEGAFDFENIGVRVPYEIARDPKTNGGQDTLYARKRTCCAPFGISYTKKVQASLSPTNKELEDGSNWSLVLDAESKKVIPHKAIPIARIISKG